MAAGLVDVIVRLAFRCRILLYGSGATGVGETEGTSSGLEPASGVGVLGGLAAVGISLFIWG